MSNSVFRQSVPVTKTAPELKPTAPVDPTEKPGDNSSTTAISEHKDTLLATYQQEIGKPYVATYFDMPTMWDKDPSIKNDLSTIEGYLNSMQAKGKLENSTKAAAKYLREMEKKAETNPYESTTNRINKLIAYIDFQRVVHGKS
jgi:hypothetical protein